MGVVGDIRGDVACRLRDKGFETLSWDVPHRRGTLDSGKHADRRRDVYTRFDAGSGIVAFDHNLAGVSSGSGGGELYFRSARPLMSQRAASLRSSVSCVDTGRQSKQ